MGSRYHNLPSLAFHPTSVLIDDIVEIVDSGNDGTTGEPLPDKIIGKGFSVLSVNQEIQLSGAGSNDSTYLAVPLSDTELTFKDLEGNDVTDLTPAASVTVKITTTSTDDGLYEVVSHRRQLSDDGDPCW